MMQHVMHECKYNTEYMESVHVSTILIRKFRPPPVPPSDLACCSALSAFPCYSLNKQLSGEQDAWHFDTESWSLRFCALNFHIALLNALSELRQ